MLLTMVGVAVGLGNVWRFPYMMGSYGGSAFLFVYLLFVVLLAVPALTAEWALGRSTRAGPMQAYPRVYGRRLGGAIGYLLLVTVLVADSYYLVVIGQIVIGSGHGALAGYSDTALQAFARHVSNAWLQYAVSLALLALSLWIIARGLNRGIERVSRLFVPFFGTIVIYLIGAALTLDGALAGLAAFLRPDFAALQAQDVFAALGQAFFSLGLGGTFFVIYGSYLADDEPLFGSALATGVGDAGAALLAGLFVVPAALSFGLDLAQGPALIFSTLPELFAVMPGGRWLGPLFLASLAMVAFLSNLAALEVAATGLRERPSRPPLGRVLGLLAALEAVLMLPSVLDNDHIATLDLIFGSGMQVTGSLLAIVGVGWLLGNSALGRQVLSGRAPGLQRGYAFWVRWLIPVALAMILILYVKEAIT